MLTLIATTLLLAAQPGCVGYGGEGSLEDQFDACLAGEWGEAGCTSGQSYASDGFTRANGDQCEFTYLIRDPHTGGFRLTWECRDPETGDETDRQTEVWIIENGARLVGDSVSGYPPADYRCEVADAHD